MKAIESCLLDMCYRNFKCSHLRQDHGQISVIQLAIGLIKQIQICNEMRISIMAAEV